MENIPELIKLLKDAKSLRALGHNELYAESFPNQRDETGVTRKRYAAEADKIEKRLDKGVALLQKLQGRI